MNCIVRSLALALVALPALAFAAENWNIDPAHTQSAFTVKRHMMVSTVKGQFEKTRHRRRSTTRTSAKSTVEVTIDVASVNTREPRSATPPQVAGLLRRRQVPDHHLQVHQGGEGGRGKLKVTGDLTMHGVTKPVVLDVTGLTQAIKDPMGLMRRGVAATTKVNRKDFGVDYGPDSIVSDSVTITIDAELVKDAPPAKK